MINADHTPPAIPTAPDLTPHQKRLAERLAAERPTDTLHRTRRADIAAAAPPLVGFVKAARISQDLKGVMHHAPSWHGLAADQREALDIIQYCIARILSGEAGQADTWGLIVDHAQGVQQRLEAK